MKRTFFDYISSASEEKIHSQTLGWLLSKNCDALRDIEKENFLKLLLEENKVNAKFNIDNEIDLTSKMIKHYNAILKILEILYLTSVNSTVRRTILVLAYSL